MFGIGTDIDKNYVSFSKKRIEAISIENPIEINKKDKKMVQLKLVC
jgi:DNA modification methylase